MQTFPLLALTICLLGDAPPDTPHAKEAAPRHVLMAGWQPPIEDEEQPPKAVDPLLPVQAPGEQHAEARPVPEYPATKPSALSGRAVAVGMLIVGVVGWLALGIAFAIVLSRQERFPAS